MRKHLFSWSRDINMWMTAMIIIRDEKSASAKATYMEFIVSVNDDIKWNARVFVMIAITEPVNSLTFLHMSDLNGCVWVAFLS